MSAEQQIQDFVITNFLFGDPTPLQTDTSFLATGIIDSTGIFELIMFLESTYCIKVEPEEMTPDNLDSVEKIIRFLEKKRNQTPNPLQ